MKETENFVENEVVEKIVRFGRSPASELIEQKILIYDQPFLKDILDAIPTFVCILNKNRQIVFANESFQNYTESTPAELLGKRPGESVNCVHSSELDSGCGASESCKYCGALHAIFESYKNSKGIQECRITQKNNDELDLLVWATPIMIQEQQFTIYALSDISSEKRKKALERIFFHDILNTAGGIRGFVEMTRDSEQDEMDELLNITYDLTNKLIDEIKAQRTISAAENNDLELNIEPFSSRELLEEVKILYANHEVSKGKNIIIKQGCIDKIVKSDKMILRRILVNLLKNALEASDIGQTVNLNCQINEGLIEFEVGNPTFIPKDIQMQMFQRSFSTKGNGRGLGTYSVKLLTEKYLNGQIKFHSAEKEGTIFKVRYPMSLD